MSKYGDNLKRYDYVVVSAIALGVLLCLAVESDALTSARVYSEKQGIQSLNYIDTSPEEWPWNAGKMCCARPGYVVDYLNRNGYAWDDERGSYTRKSDKELSEVIFGDSPLSCSDSVRQTDEDLRTAGIQIGVCGITVKTELFSQDSKNGLLESTEDFIRILNDKVDGLSIESYAERDGSQVACGTLRCNGYLFAFAAQHRLSMDHESVYISIVSISRFASHVGVDASDARAAARMVEVMGMGSNGVG